MACRASDGDCAGAAAVQVAPVDGTPRDALTATRQRGQERTSACPALVPEEPNRRSRLGARL